VTLKSGLEVIQTGTIQKLGAVSYSPSIVTIQRQRMGDLETGGRGGSKSLKMVPFDKSHTTFYWSAIVNIALSCTVFELFDVE